jgi:D-glycero-beta-D-manno-heptose-7-phosphate kinase
LSCYFKPNIVKKTEIEKLFQKFEGYKVLVIGDVMIDAYLWGNVNRISPEAPVPVIACKKQEHRLGGAANVALNVLALGAVPILCGVIGNDLHGEVFKKLMAEKGLVVDGIVTDPTRPTTTKTRIISGTHHMLRVDEEQDKAISGTVENDLFARISGLIQSMQINAIIFEDYDKGAISQDIIEKVTSLANQQSIPTLVDPKKRNFLNYKNITVFKPNFKELTEGLKLEIAKGDFDAIFKASEIMHNEANIKYMLITLSELGVFVSDKKSYKTIPAEMRDIADVSGAGDTVISIASLCLAAGLSPENIAKISNIGGGLVCEKVGVVPINKQQLLEECYRKLSD